MSLRFYLALFTFFSVYADYQIMIYCYQSLSGLCFILSSGIHFSICLVIFGTCQNDTSFRLSIPSVNSLSILNSLLMSIVFIHFLFFNSVIPEIFIFIIIIYRFKFFVNIFQKPLWFFVFHSIHSLFFIT